MDGSCAVTQGSATCGFNGGDADTLNVEHELSRWLQDLDSSVSKSIYWLSLRAASFVLCIHIDAMNINIHEY